MRKVATGEAPQQRGKSFGGIPTRFDNRGHMLLKEDEPDPAATQEYGDPKDREATDLEALVTKLSELLSEAADVAHECEEQGAFSAKYRTALEDMHTELQEQGFAESIEPEEEDLVSYPDDHYDPYSAAGLGEDR